jgi:hypothetical protein
MAMTGRAIGIAACVIGALAGCADGQAVGGTANTFDPNATATEGDSETGDAGGETESDGEAGICLPQNCEDNFECAGCDDGKTMCLLEEKRCVQCDPASGEGCDEGEVCSEFGSCIPGDLTCPTDADGVPQIECNDDPDCAACDPDHQVCAAGVCVACREDLTDACASTEVCLGNECVPKCPEECTTNAECGNCGTETTEAHACHDRKCAECTNLGSTPVGCPENEYCTDQGVCVPICGIPGQAAGTCEVDSDCAGCEGDNDACHAPINGGHGVCGPSAAGCSDLGDGIVVLPAPFDQVTNACSNDGDCAGIGIQYNVGELLRDITGIDEIDDANIDYPMSRCADVTVGLGETSVSCGVCVPCEHDTDCEDIDVDQVAGDAFGPLGAIATALLLDQLFGPNDHSIHMFCQPVAGSYGVCAPCPTLLSDCASADDPYGGDDDSCSGNCGGAAPSGCYCDDACLEYGDCCGDFEGVCTGDGCAGHCGEQAPAGCYCDEGCLDYGDCCGDYEDLCEGGGDPDSCAGHCGGQAASGCYCDGECEAAGDCCDDYDVEC